MQEGTISENSSLRKRRGESSEIEAKDDISEKSILKGTSDIQTTASKEKKPSFKDQFFTDDVKRKEKIFSKFFSFFFRFIFLK